MKQKLTNILILIFFLHGGLYLIFPELMYVGSWIKYVKYYTLFGVIVLNFNSIKISGIILYGIILSVFFVLLTISYSGSTTISELIIRILPYAAPASIFLLSDTLKKYDWDKLIKIVTYLSIILCFLDFFFFKPLIKDSVSVFSSWRIAGFYRTVSIYFNPNAAGIMFFLNFYYYLTKMAKHNDLSIKNIMICILLIACMILTGSKTPLILIPLSLVSLIVLKNFKVSRRSFALINKFLISLLVIMFLALLALPFINTDIFTTREIKIETLILRFEQLFSFSDLLSQNFLFPNNNRAINEMLSDNAYLQLWLDFGFIGFILFFACFLIPLILKRKICVYEFNAIFLILVAGFAMTVFYILSAYIFWYLIFKKPLVNMNNNQNKNT